MFTTASLKYVIKPIKAVFHLFAIFVKVVEPDDMSTCRTLFSKVRNDCSSTCAERRGLGLRSRTRRVDSQQHRVDAIAATASVRATSRHRGERAL